MTVSSLHQLGIFLLSCLGGLIAGAFYSLLTAVRERGKGRGLSFVADAAFWLVTGAALIKMSLDFNDGGIRGYQILGMSCGFLLHYLLLSPLTLHLARLIVAAAAFLLFPLVFLLRGASMYIASWADKFRLFRIKFGQKMRRVSLRRKNHKKIQKNCKKLL